MNKQTQIIKITKDIIPLGIIGVLIVGSWIFLHDPDFQFDSIKSKIERIDFECVEGFDGIEYGYTGEIQYRHGLFNGLGNAGFLEITMSNEQEQVLLDMLESKLSRLPCYEKYVELGEIKT